MKKEDKIREEVEKTLESLEGLERAAPRPFFFTRLQARLERENDAEAEPIRGWLLQPQVAIAAILLLLLMNVGILVADSSIRKHESRFDREVYLEWVAKEYNLSSFSSDYSQMIVE
jgi:hypothetical protein